MLQNKLRYLVLLISIGLLSILYNEYVMGVIFLTILVMPFVLFALLCYCYGMVKVELLSLVHVANKGETIPISVQLSNPTIFPVSNITIYLKYKNAYSTKQFKKEFSVSLDQKTTNTVMCNIKSEFSGNLEISLSGIRIYDYMKIFSLKKKSGNKIKIAVLPKFHEILEMDMLKRNRSVVESDYYSTVKSGDDPSEVFAIREYKEGDRPQRIHWKLSIKQDQLMIKDFSDPLNCSMLIFVNLRVPKGENLIAYMDSLLESSLSLSYSLLQMGQIHYLSWYDESHGACRRIRIVQEKDLFEAVDGLLDAHGLSENMDAMAAYLAEHPNDQYTDLFFFTGEVSQTMLTSLTFLHSNSKRIIHIQDDNQELKEKELSDEPDRISNFRKRVEEVGIGLFTINVGNLKDDIEQLNLD